MSEKIEFKIREDEEYIPLMQLLKAVNIVASGGEAKMIIDASMVKLNGEIEHRRRAKVRIGDIVETEIATISII